MRGKYVDIDRDLLLETYERCGRSLNKTAKVFGTNSTTIKRRFVEYGLEYDPKAKYSCNEDFFDELNERSLYWLGYLATDGNVRKQGYSYFTKLALATKDICMLKKLKEHIGFTGTIKSYVRKNCGNCTTLKKPEYYISVIYFSSKKIFDRLAEFNIVPAKTYIYRFPQQLRDHPLVNHFIRGCIDGDGWIRRHRYNGTNEQNEVRIGFCGTEMFVRETFAVIKEKLNIDTGCCAQVAEGRPTWRFEFTALHDVDRLVDWLYDGATVYLERKRKETENIKELVARYEASEPHTLYMIPRGQLEQDYNEIGSIKGVAAKYEVDPLTIKSRLVKYDIDHFTTQRVDYNFDFFSDENETEVKYYWAGFLAGKSTFAYKSGKYFLAINNKDEEVIKSFMEHSKMSFHIAKLKSKDREPICQINIFNDTIIGQLEKFGIDKDKQNDYVIPDWLLESSFLRHFLRGYIDARSALQLYKGKLTLNIKNNRAFLEQIDGIFKQNCNHTLTAKIKDTKYGNCQVIYMRNQAKAVLGWLYDGSSVYLPKKRDIFGTSIEKSIA